jgi:gamma-glutamylcyclotransferase (GGCT)/AIG2-like uncharacterized protein YtfP
VATFRLFTYGTLRRDGRAAGIMAACEHLGSASIRGVLYDIDGRFPALVLYGGDPVHGEVWRCPASMLAELDAYEGVGSGLFRRIAAEVETDRGPAACWLYAAGPALSRRLVPQARLRGGRWPPPG